MFGTNSWWFTYIWVSKTIASTIEAFKTWLTTHNTSIYYPLTTPYLSLIEDNNLIEQLDNLEKAQSYNGQTNINQTNNDLSANMEAQILVNE